MSRNNEERIGIKNADADLPLVPEVIQEEENLPNEEEQQEPKPNNPPLSFAAPTEIVDLPSGGRYYDSDHPLFGVDSLEIRFMTAKDEDILTSKTLLKKGLAIDRLLQNILIDRRISPNDLLLGDKNALVIAARITGFGEDYQTRVMCPVCSESSDSSFDLTECAFYPGAGEEDLTEMGVQITADSTFIVELPKMGYNVEFKLLDGNDERKFTHDTERRKKRKLPENLSTTQFKSFIVAVEGHEDKSMISNLVDAMPAQDAHYLRKIYELVSPNVEMKLPFECSNCDNFQEDLEVPLTADFFWPR